MAALQAHLHLLVVAASAWNITAAGAPLPAAPFCLVLLGIAFFILASLCVSSLPDSRPSRAEDVTSEYSGGLVWLLDLRAPRLASLRFEVAWCAVLVVLELAATIGTTVDVPVSGASPAAVASHAFLVPVAWLSTVCGIIYLAALTGAVLAHRPMFPGIWSAPAASVDWFVHRTLNAGGDGNDDKEDSWTRYLGEIESSAARKHKYGGSLPVDLEKGVHLEDGQAEEKAPWARQNVRRGVDDPFALRGDGASDSGATERQNAALPPLPLRVEAKGGKSAGSRFIERFRESRALARGASTSPVFAPGVADHDAPIPLPRLSEWIRADALRVDVHADPQMP
ncbi:hypothetical protein B0H10DRAFT_2207733 [Mycena sp. CBHHK59/15]|nr:hypothetical protein B0H10DRAFT_2207733 [Mycena sp. CBHHK59/15]